MEGGDFKNNIYKLLSSVGHRAGFIFVNIAVYKENIETLQYYMTTLLTTEDYMKFIFTNKDIEARFHRYINNILVHKSDGEKYLQLEEHINNQWRS